MAMGDFTMLNMGVVFVSAIFVNFGALKI